MKRLQFALAGAILFAWTCAAQAQSAGGPMYSPYGNQQMMGPMGSYGPPQGGGYYGAQQASYPMQGDPSQEMLYGPSGGGGPMPMGGGPCGDCGIQPNCAECSNDGAVHYGYFNLEGFYARRTNESKNQPLITDSGTTIVDVKDLDFIYEPGVRATAGYMLGDGLGIEGSYFGQFDFHGGLFAVDPNAGLSAPGTTAGTLGGDTVDFDGVTNMSVVYRSRITSGELNFVIPYGNIQFLSGTRVVQVSEFMDLSGGTGETSDYAIHTMNNLYGGQLGARGQWQIWRMTFDAQVKAGLYDNYSNQQQTIGDLGNTVSLRDSSANKLAPAFVGEVGVEATMPLSDWLTARLGYTAVWIEEVALAPSQLNFDITDATMPNYVNVRSGILLHGFTAGLEARW